MKKWNELPKVMQNDKVKYYYDILLKHEKELKLKRAFDIICSLSMIIILSPVLIVLSVMIKLDSKGPVLFKQVRVTTYGRKFKIYKFRSMYMDAEERKKELWLIMRTSLEHRLQQKVMLASQEWDICLERYVWMSYRSCLMS